MKLMLTHHIFWIVIVILSGAVWANNPDSKFYHETPRNVLFVRNSFTYYNNSLHSHYGGFASFKMRRSLSKSA